MTASTFTDIEPRMRLYQDVTRTFEDIITEAYDDSGIGDLIAVRGKEDIKDVILQYQETDWQFTLRMAGRLGTVVIPNVMLDEPQFTLGVPTRPGIDEKNDIIYQMGRGFAEFRDKHNESIKFIQRYKQLMDVSESQNFLYYKMRSENSYKLGDNVNVGGKALTVVQKSFAYEKGGIEEIYILGHEQEFAVPFHHNRHIVGLELIGTVLARDKYQMKLLLDIDANRPEYEKTWFYYSPVTNNGMYSMPLEDESVMLHWQSEDDHDAVIVRPVRKNSDAMPHHGERHFLDENDNHMKMVPGKIEYTNPVGSMKWLESIGFDISTDKDFVLKAEKDIAIKSSKQVEMHSPAQII